MDLSPFEAALDEQERRAHDQIDWSRIQRRSRSLARRPYWEAIGSAVVAITNLLFGWFADVPFNIFVGCGTLFFFFGRLSRLSEVRERLANLADDPGELMQGYLKDLSRLSASRLLDSLFWFGFCLFFILASLFGKHPEAAFGAAIFTFIFSVISWKLAKRTRRERAAVVLMNG